MEQKNSSEGLQKSKKRVPLQMTNYNDRFQQSFSYI